MIHVEDKVLYGGVDGTRQAILALRDLKNKIKHNEGNVSVKWDGAPSIFAGTDPNDGKFFVAKKSLFNKNPKVYKSFDDIDNDVSGQLADKLKQCLTYLPQLGIQGVVQGDFLFGHDDLKIETINGKEYVIFHPNTIAYAVPVGSMAANNIQRAKVGIVFHTNYTFGDNSGDFATLRANYGFDLRAINKSDDVFVISSMMNIPSNNMDTNDVSEELSQCGKLFNQISSETLKGLQSSELSSLIEQFNNSYVRQGKDIGDSRRHLSNFIAWLTSKYEAQIAARKTDRGKASQRQKLDNLLSFFTTNDVKKVFDLQKRLVIAKLKLINTLDIINEVKTFVKTVDGYAATKAEGYVAIDTLGGDAVKLVDRMEFSYNNFSPDILKGWEKPRKENG